MEKTINIRICTGTTCYVMGASDLLTLEDFIPEHLKYHVKISGSTCLGMCRQPSGDSQSPNRLKSPFVEVDGKIIEQATIEKILIAVEAEFAGVIYADNE
ncbi:MAG: hypothetical protein JEZ04_02800 [Spirochaetales bacterium]|nr:hypothetical protein [Spirochaetales bacterium]